MVGELIEDVHMYMSNWHLIVCVLFWRDSSFFLIGRVIRRIFVSIYY